MGNLKTWVKAAYGSGDLAYNVATQSTAFFLLFFYTDVMGLPAALAGAIMFIAKLWDAVTDPVLGFLIDRTRSRWGNKRPYLLFGALPFGLSIFLLFWMPGFLGAAPELLRAAWALGTFILFCSAITVVNIPYGALSASLTLDSRERSSLVSFRMVFGLAGTLTTALATRPLVEALGGGAQGWGWTGLIYGVLGAVLTLVVFASVREVAQEPQSFRFRDGLEAAARSGPFLVLAASTVLIMTGINILAGSVVYFYKYSLGQEGGETLALGLLLILAALSVPLFNFLAGRTSKRTAYLSGLSLIAAALIGLGVLGEFPSAVLPLFALAGVGMATIYLCPWSMVPDTVEHSQWVTGKRREGALFGFFFFCFKVGSALALFLVGLILGLAGYQPDSAATPQVLTAIRFLISAVPLLFIANGAVLLAFYPLDKVYHARILKDLEDRGEI